jgi:hypothetical protein
MMARRAASTIVERPGLDAELIFDPVDYDGKAIPHSLVEDLAQWCAARNLFGGFKRVRYDANGDKQEG